MAQAEEGLCEHTSDTPSAQLRKLLYSEAQVVAPGVWLLAQEAEQSSCVAPGHLLSSAHRLSQAVVLASVLLPPLPSLPPLPQPLRMAKATASGPRATRDRRIIGFTWK